MRSSTILLIATCALAAPISSPDHNNVSSLEPAIPDLHTNPTSTTTEMKSDLIELTHMKESVGMDAEMGDKSMKEGKDGKDGMEMQKTRDYCLDGQCGPCVIL
ncbi:hypothetical protein CC86DRAFT_369113 [Ophiobolus disseminans]|uniref:Uncharacterized protein n=1 Tax=Ophiobolus disseminans TaxID=1469910 RepID=A0A6A7A553_9PLEO|nr:hypothetical protein CC86DRAFT_369113 [Ophiobolus disseminans]